VMAGCDGLGGLAGWKSGVEEWRSGGERKRKSPGAIKTARVFGIEIVAPCPMRTNALESAERAILRTYRGLVLARSYEVRTCSRCVSMDGSVA
jgi:hypothetical protein